MSSANGHAKRSEKGLLTQDNCVVTLIDHQPQMLFGASYPDRQSIINNTVAFAKATRVFDVPVVLTTVETHSFSGNLWPQIQAVFPKQTPVERSSMNPWDDQNFVAAIKATGRKKIVLAGLWTETCVALPTVQAIHDGYEIYVVEDCCGDVSQLAHDNAMKRMIQAGAKPVTSLSVMLELQRDWAQKDTYDAVMDIVKTHYGAYGIGVEYVYTMVHKAPCVHHGAQGAGDSISRVRDPFAQEPPVSRIQARIAHEGLSFVLRRRPAGRRRLQPARRPVSRSSGGRADRPARHPAR